MKQNVLNVKYEMKLTYIFGYTLCKFTTKTKKNQFCPYFLGAEGVFSLVQVILRPARLTKIPKKNDK